MLISTIHRMLGGMVLLMVIVVFIRGMSGMFKSVVDLIEWEASNVLYFTKSHVGILYTVRPTKPPKRTDSHPFLAQRGDFVAQNHRLFCSSLHRLSCLDRPNADFAHRETKTPEHRAQQHPRHKQEKQQSLKVIFRNQFFRSQSSNTVPVACRVVTS